MKQKHIHTYRENRLMAAKGKVGRKTDWEIGISRYELICIGWINNKVLLYSMGNYIQYPIKTTMEKDIKKNIYICITVTVMYSRN